MWWLKTDPISCWNVICFGSYSILIYCVYITEFLCLFIKVSVLLLSRWRKNMLSFQVYLTVTVVCELWTLTFPGAKFALCSGIWVSLRQPWLHCFDYLRLWCVNALALIGGSDLLSRVLSFMRARWFIGLLRFDRLRFLLLYSFFVTRFVESLLARCHSLPRLHKLLSLQHFSLHFETFLRQSDFDSLGKSTEVYRYLCRRP